MKTHYVLPVCFAVAAHGALLFGFTKNPRPAKPPNPETFLCPFEIRQIDEEPPVVIATDPADITAKTAPEVPQPPRTAEPPPAIDPGPLPTMVPPPIAPMTTRDVDRIVTGTLGIPGGTGLDPRTTRVLPIGALDRSPRTRFQAAPLYPHDARRAGMVGEVLVEFMVDEQGRVHEPRVVRSSDRVFEEATLRAVARWQFEPGRRDGRIVRFRMSAPVVFSLNE